MIVPILSAPRISSEVLPAKGFLGKAFVYLSASSIAVAVWSLMLGSTWL